MVRHSTGDWHLSDKRIATYVMNTIQQSENWVLIGCYTKPLSFLALYLVLRTWNYLNRLHSCNKIKRNFIVAQLSVAQNPAFIVCFVRLALPQ